MRVRKIAARNRRPCADRGVGRTKMAIVTTHNVSNPAFLQENQPSPLALLAATCSKIGHPSEGESGTTTQDGQSEGVVCVVGATRQVGGVIQSVGTAGVPAAQQYQTLAQPQVQPSLAVAPLGGQVVQPLQQAPATQLIATPVTGPGGTIIYNLVQQPAPIPQPVSQIQQYQTVTVQGQDGQEQTILVPVSSLATPQLQAQNVLPQAGQIQTVVTPQGQIIRTQAPQVLTQHMGVGGAVPMGGGNAQLGNLGGIFNLGGLQGLVRPQLQTVQLPTQVQTVQVAVSTPNGTVLQNVQVPIQGGMPGAVINNQGANLLNVMTQQQVAALSGQQQASIGQVAANSSTPKSDASKKSKASEVNVSSTEEVNQSYSGVNSDGYIVIQPVQQANGPQASVAAQVSSPMVSFQGQTQQTATTTNTTNAASSICNQAVPSGMQNLVLSNGQIVQAVTPGAQVNAIYQIINQNGQVIQTTLPPGLPKVPQLQQQEQQVQLQNLQNIQGMQLVNGAALSSGLTLFGAQTQQTQTLQTGGQVIMSANGSAAG